jgi:hypothetical protein
MGRKNPYLYIGPGLFDPETPGNYVPLEDVPPETLRKLKPINFTEEEWEELDLSDRDQILENDPEAKKRVELAVEYFEDAYNWLKEGGFAADNVDDYISDAFEQMLADQAGALTERLDPDVVEELCAPFEDKYSDEEISEALEEMLADNNAYEYSVEDEDWARTSGYEMYRDQIGQEAIYVECDKMRELFGGMGTFELQEAVYRINEATYDEFELDTLDVEKTMARKRNVFEKYVDIPKDAVATLNPEYVIEGMKDILGKAEPEDVAAVEERVVHRFDDGFYVQNLLASELPAEGKRQRMCVGRPDMGYMRAVREGLTAIWSLRKPSGKPLLTFELELDDQGRPRDVVQVKGNSNRRPGFALGQEYETGAKFRRGEVEKAIEIIDRVIDLDPFDVDDMKPALARLKGEDPRQALTDETMDVLFRRRNPEDPKSTGFCAPSRHAWRWSL